MKCDEKVNFFGMFWIRMNNYYNFPNIINCSSNYIFMSFFMYKCFHRFRIIPGWLYDSEHGNHTVMYGNVWKQLNHPTFHAQLSFH